MPAFPEPPPTLADDRVALRLAAERDIPEILIAHQDDPQLARRLGLDRPPSGAELGRRAEAAADERARGGSLWLTVLAAHDGGFADECRGQIDVREVEADHRRASLEIWIAPRDRGAGLGRAALALAGRWLLTDGGLARVQLLAEPANEPLRRAALAAGFVAEGVLRGHRLGRDGRRADAEVLSLVAADLGPAPADRA
jgi:RimJ/RimL family protein N-acetyltransferase